jgi:hypothetical protein
LTASLGGVTPKACLRHERAKSSGLGGCLETQKAKQALLFVNKKKKKNFDSLKHLALTMINPAGIKSFLHLYFKKEALSCVSKHPVTALNLPQSKNHHAG